MSHNCFLAYIRPSSKSTFSSFYFHLPSYHLCDTRWDDTRPQNHYNATIKHDTTGTTWLSLSLRWAFTTAGIGTLFCLTALLGID